MKTIALALALTAGLAIPAASIALAQETRASASAKLGSEFKASDSNRNGTLELAEVEARIGRMKAGVRGLPPERAKQIARLWFTRADANGNGHVTQAESQALMKGVFERYDLNNDGRVDGAEAAKARAAVKAGPKGR